MGHKTASVFVCTVAPALFRPRAYQTIPPPRPSAASLQIHARIKTMDIQGWDQLENERQNILLELDELGLQGPVSSALQARYNQIIDDQFKPSLPDPLTILPPEICMQIFWEAISDDYYSCYQAEALLLLSNVSTSWCRYLMSTSSFWGNISLSCEREDNLAMVVTCLTLSKECKVTLFVERIQPGWETYKAILIPHTGRITKIVWWTLLDKDPFPFIEPLGNLPVLKRIRFLHDLTVSSDDEKHFFQLMQSAPSLVSPVGLMLSAKMLHHPRVANFTHIRTRASFPEFLNLPSGNQADLQSQLQDFPKFSSNLRSLGLIEPSPGYGDLFKHYFQSIQRIEIALLSEDTLGELLVALSFCPRISHLHLIISEMVQSIPYRPEYSALRSLDQLEIVKYAGQGQLDLDCILERIPTIMPCLQNVTFYGRILLKDKGFHYLGQLKDLRKLSIPEGCNSVQVKDPVCFDNLEHLDLSLDTPYDQSFMLFTKLRSLRGYTRIRDDSILDYPHIYAASYAASPSSFSTLVNLAVSIVFPVRLQLGLLPLLESISLSDSLAMTWVSDILEQILITPKICPKLHMITTQGLLVEWDILLLMLLRRNFLHGQTVSKIQGLGFPYWLPPSLLQPISQLLRGRFVPDLDLEAFSSERITKILYRTPSESARCYICSLMLIEECENIVRRYCSIYIADSWLTAIGNGWEYSLVDALPDPPLPEYMAQWLTRKWDRRRAFVAGERDAERRGQEWGMCRDPSPMPQPFITGYTMEGLNVESSTWSTNL
ncbi:hypothetical protein FRC20_006235 [Serendipita sp. 405]|nr:hypothetical protein FRC20_006235 [Serendipita sp. 405]